MLARFAEGKGYEVIKINPNWEDPLSHQIFEVGDCDIVFGFSMGAVLACMIGQKYPCHKVILASMTPVRNLSTKTIKMLGDNIAQDLKRFYYGGVTATYFYGEKELDRSLAELRSRGVDFEIVPKTGHQLNSRYLDMIMREFED